MGTRLQFSIFFFPIWNKVPSSPGWPWSPHVSTDTTEYTNHCASSGSTGDWTYGFPHSGSYTQGCTFPLTCPGMARRTQPYRSSASHISQAVASPLCDNAGLIPAQKMLCLNTAQRKRRCRVRGFCGTFCQWETEAQKDELTSYIRSDTLTLRKAATVHGHTVALGASSCLWPWFEWLVSCDFGEKEGSIGKRHHISSSPFVLTSWVHKDLGRSTAHFRETGSTETRGPLLGRHMRS